MRHDAFEPNTPEREIVKSSIPQAKKVRSPRHRMYFRYIKPEVWKYKLKA